MPETDQTPRPLTSQELDAFRRHVTEKAAEATVLPPGFAFRLQLTLELMQQRHPLALMFEAQMAFQRSLRDKHNAGKEPEDCPRWPFDIHPLSLREGSEDEKVWTEFLRDMCDAAIDEAGEFKDAIPWKPWSNKLADRRLEEEFDRRWDGEHLEHLQMEVVDQLRFVFNQALILRMTPEMILAMWLEKCGISRDRIHGGEL